MYFYPPQIWKIGSAQFPGYGTCLCFGIVAFLLTFFFLRRNPKFKIRWRYFIWVLGAGGFFFFLGAYMWDHLCHYLSHDGTTGGISFLGGVVFGLPLFYVLLLLVYPIREQRMALMNLIFPCIAIAHAFGRIGCFFGGCCYGLPTDGYGIIYGPESAASIRYGGWVSVFPIQLVESFFLVLLYLFLLFFPKKSYRMESYCLGYGTARFIIEFFRGDNRGVFIPGLTPSQFLSILLILFAAIHLVIRWKIPYKELDYPGLETRKMRRKRLEGTQEPDGASEAKVN